LIVIKILFLGDSITEGANAGCAENTFVNLVKSRTGFDVLNFGVSGSRIAPQKVSFNGQSQYDDDFLKRAKRMPKDADLVFVFGGTNDFGHGDAPIGKAGDKKDTFYAALYNLYDYLIDTYGRDNIVTILPLHRYDENSKHREFFVGKKEDSPVLKEYVDAIRLVSNSYGFKVLDFIDKFGYVDETNKASNPFISEDGLHPNKVGHELLANLILEFLNKSGYLR